MRHATRLLQRRRTLLFSAIGLTVACFVAQSHADPGDLDPSFGTGGVANVTIGTAAYANAVAIQGDGKIVVVGYGLNGPHGNMVAVRLDSSGALDPSFGTGGVVEIAGADQGIAEAVAIQPDGKILVGGGIVTDADLDYDFRIARLLPANGQLDSTFGDAGIVQSAAASADPGIDTLVVQADGKILAGGQGKRRLTSSSPNRDFLVTRYLGDGSLDTAFANAGSATVSMGRRAERVRSLLLQSDGSIVAAGYAAQGTSARAALARLTPAGALDPSFGRNGRQRLRLGRVAYGVDAALLPGDDILLAGMSVNKPDPSYTSSIFFTELTASGNTPLTLSGSPAGTAYYSLSRVALQSDGKIVAVGTIQGGGVDTTDDVYMIRLLPDRSIDMTFGDAGSVRSVFSAQDAGYGVAIDSGGNIVVVGYSVVSGQSRILVARYLP